MKDVLSKVTFNKIGIVIVCYNRPTYTRQCLESIAKASLPENTTVILIDDCSTDPEAIDLFNGFFLNGVSIIKYRNNINQGIVRNLKMGFDKLFAEGCSIVMNFDNDAIIKPNALERLIETKIQFPNNIVTGFNCLTRNKDSSERHKVIDNFPTYNLKKSVGGLNMVFEYPQYTQFVNPAMEQSIAKGGNWDHMTCINSEKVKLPIVCTVPSVVQHIGIESSMGHSSTEEPDTADDFEQKLSLANITLLGIDCVNASELAKAIDASTRNINFGAVKLLSSQTINHKSLVKIPLLNSKAAYSEFCIKHLYDYVATDFVLLVQFDGYVVNQEAWDDDFFNYDYIGATWLYKDNKNVGNGGFSLRSRKLLKILKEDKYVKELHPEDDKICRLYRPYLEKYYDIKFAPEEVANRFAIEAYGSNVIPGANKYNGQFGFHGTNVDFKDAHINNKPQLIRRR